MVTYHVIAHMDEKFDDLRPAVLAMLRLMTEEDDCAAVAVVREADGDDPRVMVEATREDEEIVLSEIEGDATLVLEQLVLDGLVPVEWPGFESN